MIARHCVLRKGKSTTRREKWIHTHRHLREYTLLPSVIDIVFHIKLDRRVWSHRDRLKLMFFIGRLLVFHASMCYSSHELLFLHKWMKSIVCICNKIATCWELYDRSGFKSVAILDFHLTLNTEVEYTYGLRCVPSQECDRLKPGDLTSVLCVIVVVLVQRCLCLFLSHIELVYSSSIDHAITTYTLGNCYTLRFNNFASADTI